MMRAKFVVIAALVVTDTVAIIAAFSAAYYLRIASGFIPYLSPYELHSYIRLTAVSVGIWLLIWAGAGLYDRRRILSGVQEYWQVIKACTFGIVVLMVISFLVRDTMVSRGWLLLTWVASIGFCGTCRFLFRRVVYRLRRRGSLSTRILVVGANEQAKTIAWQLSTSTTAGMKVIGFLDDYLPPGAPVLNGTCVLGSPRDLERIAAETSADQAIVVSEALAWESLRDVLQHSVSNPNQLEVRLSPGLYQILTTGVTLSHEAFVPLLTVERVRITGKDALLKGALDYGLGTALLLLGSPILALLAMLVAIANGRRVLTNDVVIGRGGRTFYAYRFSTSVAERGNGKHIGLRYRLYGSGFLSKVLQKTGVERLPQLVNVVIGNMSLVGPRTIKVGDEKLYGGWLPNLLTSKPGVVGPWSVTTARDLDAEMRLTLYYLRNWTIWFDIQILFQALRNGLSVPVRYLFRPHREQPEPEVGPQEELRVNGVPIK